MNDWPKKIDEEWPDLGNGRGRTTFGNSTKVYVEDMGRKLYNEFRISKLRVAKIISQKMDIKLRTVYSWIQNIDQDN